MLNLKFCCVIFFFAWGIAGADISIAAGRANDSVHVTITTFNYPDNDLIVEFGGNAFYYSLNYERWFSRTFSARIGVAYDIFGGDPVASDHFALLVATASGYFGAGENKFEYGGGFLFGRYGNFWQGSAMYQYSHHNAQAATFILGYRYQPRGGGLIFRFDATPVVGLFSDHVLFPIWFGLSLGYSF